MKDGWISIHRKIRDHYLFKEKRVFSRFEAWLDLLLSANHDDNKLLLNGELIEVKRGSFVTSELKLMDRWSWSKSKVRSFLELLTNELMIEKVSDSKKTTLTIVKFNEYQLSKTTKKPQKDFKKTSEELQKDTNNNENNYNNLNNINQLTLINRKQKFEDEIRLFCFQYSQEMLESFYLYWSEENQKGNKMKFELQVTWNLEGRLRTWHKKSEEFKLNKNGSKRNQQTDEGLLAWINGE